jgi:hypothetical protein
MDHIARTSRNPLVRAVAKLLADHVPNARVVVVENPDFNGGRYQPASHTIEIGRGGMNAITLMHETVHSLTHGALYRAFENVAQAARSTLQARTARGECAEDHPRNHAALPGEGRLQQPEHVLALKDEHEFVSEALNNPNIQLDARRQVGPVTKFTNAIRSTCSIMPARTRTSRSCCASRRICSAHRTAATSSTVFHSRSTATPRRLADRRAARREGSRREAGRRPNLHKLDPKTKLREGVLNWTTLNNGMHWLDTRIGEMKAQFGAARHDKLDTRACGAGAAVGCAQPPCRWRCTPDQRAR